MKMSISTTMSGGIGKGGKLGSLVSQSSYALRPTPSRTRNPKKKKVTQLTLLKRGLYRVFDNEGIERTPKLLFDPEYPVIEEWQPTVLDYVDADLTSTGSQITVRNLPQSSPFSYGSRQQHSASLQMSFTNIANVDSYKEQTRTIEADIISLARSDDRFSDIAPSAFRLRELPSREFFPPHSKVPLIAKETNSFTLFSLNSVIVPADTEEAEIVKEDNEFYDSITVGKRRYKRKLNTAEQQTPSSINTSETSMCPKIRTKNGTTWVTEWKLYDEYLGIGEQDSKRENQGLSMEEQWALLSEDERFFNQGITLERILGAPTYRETQLTYKKSIQLDPLALEVQFTYSGKVLWVYETHITKKKPVTAIAINPLFSEIIAVGHGKFFYSEVDKGLVCIWCAKNPKHPERIYKFSSSVICLDFATWTPNWIAAGFLNGDLLVLDISSMEKKIMYSKNSVSCDSYERVIFTKWWICVDIFGKKEERLMITTGDGRIIQLRRRLGNLVPFQMMRISKTEGKVKGIECLQKCEAEEIPMVRFPAARCVVRYPKDDQFYLVSGEDGTVHKCSANFFSQHVESFLAHSGPVYALKFSPFCNKIFLTCGADGAVRLWVLEIFEPLITLTMGPEPTEDADWSPRNSTIIASISDSNLYLWDLRRKTYHPASRIQHPNNVKFCSVQFSSGGNNLLLGDINGSVYVMALYGMPFEEKFKEEILAASIEKELVVKPKLLKLLKKSGPPFSS